MRPTTHTHTRLTTLCPGLPGWADTRKVKPIWILLKQEIVSGSGISWAICKSALRSRQITTPVPHHSVFYRPDALPAAQPTASKHWRQTWGLQHTTKHWRSVKLEVSNTEYAAFSLKIFPLTFPSQLPKSPTFCGFPDKWSAQKTLIVPG